MWYSAGESPPLRRLPLHQTAPVVSRKAKNAIHVACHLLGVTGRLTQFDADSVRVGNIDVSRTLVLASRNLDGPLAELLCAERQRPVQRPVEVVNSQTDMRSAGMCRTSLVRWLRTVVVLDQLQCSSPSRSTQAISILAPG